MNDIEHPHDLAETIILSQEQTLHKLEEVQLSAEQRKAELNNLMDELIRTDVEPKRFTAIGRGQNRILIHNFPYVFTEQESEIWKVVQYFVITQHGYFGLNYYTRNLPEDSQNLLQNPFTPVQEYKYHAAPHHHFQLVLKGKRKRLWQSYVGISFEKDNEGIQQLKLKANRIPLMGLVKIDNLVEMSVEQAKVVKLDPEQVAAVTNSLEETYVGYLEKAKKANEQLTGGVIFQRRKPKSE